MSANEAGRKLGEAHAIREVEEGEKGDVVKLVLVPRGNDADNFYGHYEEFVWARELATLKGRAVYELQNNAYFHPLVKGDKVTASLDQWSTSEKPRHTSKADPGSSWGSGSRAQLRCSSNASLRTCRRGVGI